MTEFLSSLKADLLDRRLTPLVALVLAALVAAVVYAVLAGGSGTSTPAASVSPVAPSSTSRGLSISHVTPETAVAEVTSGSSLQHRGASHDPFVPLPGALKTSTTSTTTPSSTSSGSSTTGAGSSGTSPQPSSSGSSAPSEPAPSKSSKPSKPAKPKTVYHVAVLFGEVPAAGAEAKELTPYENLKLLTPLPSAAQPLIVYRGVTAGGQSATFTLVGEAILHGEASCLPSPSQCEAIDLHTGHSEELEYLTPAGQTVTFKLTLVSITSTKASAADVAKLVSEESKAGRSLLRHDGLMAIPYLHASSQAGVLVFSGHPSFAHRSSRR